MNCIICKSPDIEMKTIDEEIKIDKDIILVTIDVLVCNNCGERYYDSRTIRKLEEINTRLQKKDIKIENVGKIFRAKVA